MSAVASGDVKPSEEGKYPVKKEDVYPTIKNNVKPVVPLAHPEVINCLSKWAVGVVFSDPQLKSDMSESQQYL